MKLLDIIKLARDKITRGEIREGLQIMLSLDENIDLKGYSSEIKNLSAKLSIYHKSERIGLNTNNIELNKITHSLLEIMNVIESDSSIEKFFPKEIENAIIDKIYTKTPGYSKFEGEVVFNIIDSIKRGSSRNIKFFIAILLFSILTFSSYWNSRHDSWQSELVRFYKAVDKYNSDDKLSKKEQKQIDDAIALHSGDTSRIKNIDTELMIERVYRNTDEFSKTFKIPIIGLAFHINDLGLIGGFSTMIVLIMFFYSLEREVNNLLLLNDTLKIMSNKYQRITINYASMSQLLSFGALSKKSDLLRLIPFFLLVLPLISYIFIFIHDCQTFSFGEVINRKRALMGLIASGIFLGINGLITLSCISSFGSINKTWRKIYIVFQTREKAANNG